MRTSEAAKYARWAATAAVALALVVAGVYAWRRWQANQAQKDAPPLVPVEVKGKSETFSFSKTEGDRTLFTVRASQLTELREGGKSLLEDVWITMYGRAGQRYDNVHASKCDYLPTDGRIVCAGDVKIDLESAVEAAERPGQRAIRIRTANISFHRESGEARTDQPVEFQFPYGTGRAVGLSYSTERGVVRLEREIEATLITSGAPPQAAVQPAGEAGDQPAEQPIKMTASAMEYRRETRIMRLLGPVRTVQGSRELTAGEMTLKFDAALHAERLVASGSNGAARPQLRWVEADSSERQLVAGEFVALFAPDGRATKLTAQGNVDGTARYGLRQDKLVAQRVEIEMSERNQPRAMTAQGGVRIDSQEGTRAQRLETEALRLDLAAGRASSRARSAETLAPAVVELHEGEEVTRLRAARLTTDFGPGNRLTLLRGSGGVEIVRQLARGPEQRTVSAEFAVRFGAGGAWTEAQQSGSVRFREGERSVEAERARMVRATDTLILEERATVADALTRTTAAKIEINQRTGEAVATGNVRTSYLRSGAGPNLAREPAHISADQLRAGRVSGKAAYTGRGRLWQGDAVIEAERIDLDRTTQRLDASGKVRGVFPEAAVASPSGAGAESKGNGGQRAGGVVRFAAGKLSYFSAEGKARLEESVSVETTEARLAAREITLEFEGVNGTQKVARALATGGCTVRQGTRRGVAEQCAYDAGAGKFVLSGGEPALSDPVFGTTTGRQLTFFLADDRILVETEEGMRTVTRHRVEK